MSRQHILGIGVLAIALLLALAPETVLGQCPMCRVGAESALNEGDQTPAGLNAGIMYLFATPYLLVASIGFWWWYRNRNVN
jgi:hypothetical protein